MGQVDDAVLSRKAKGKAKSGDSKTHAEFGYIECDLTSDDKQQLKGYIETGDISPSMAFTLVADGYQFGVKPDTKGTGFVATLIDRSDTTVFENKCLVGRGASPASATCSVLYKHFYKLSEDWANAATPPDVDFG